MKRELRDKWVAALRSGRYKQTNGTLNKKVVVAGKARHEYCCLGVLCRVAGEPFKLSNTFGSTEEFGVDGDKRDPGLQAGELPGRLVREFGLVNTGRITIPDRATKPTVPRGKRIRGQKALIEMNDELKWDFKRIADWVETHVPVTDD